MSIVVQEQCEKPFRVPGYAGYVPGLKYAFGHTYGYSESRLFKAHHPGFRTDTNIHEKLTPYQPPLRESPSIRAAEDVCLQRNGVHQKISKSDDQPRRVQWTDDGQVHPAPDPGVMDIIDPHELEPLRNASIQCSLEETLEKGEERERLRSVATQWSDQETHREKRFNAATQWSPVDFTSLKTIPGYTGHLPGRHYVNPGKTFCQEMDALLTTFHPKSTAVLPISRHNFTSALQQMPERPPEGKDDPYFDKRPPSTYANNYPIPGYKGFVPRVRTSTSSLGIRYIKAVEKSLHALHEQKHNRQNRQESDPDTSENSPKQFAENRPLHTPRHKPHPRQQLSEEDDWRLVYRRPPSTYDENTKTYIPGYKGFVPHLRGSPNAVGVRYSKAAQRCLLKSCADRQNNPRQSPVNMNDISANEDIPPPPNENEDGNHLGDEDKENEDVELVNDSNLDDPDEPDYLKANSLESNRLKKEVSANRPYRKQHADYLSSRKPSTYRSDERYPIPGYQGFVPRLRDSPTTLGLRYTKAAVKTLEDVHRTQSKREAENYG